MRLVRFGKLLTWFFVSVRSPPAPVAVMDMLGVFRPYLVVVFAHYLKIRVGSFCSAVTNKICFGKLLTWFFVSVRSPPAPVAVMELC